MILRTEQNRTTPDKYQAVVTYTAVKSGMFGDDGEQVTQYYELAAQNDNERGHPEAKKRSVTF